MKVLFVFHHADITGAALALYSTIEWLHEHSDLQMTFLLKDTGVLKTGLANYGKVYEWETKEIKPPGRLSRIRNRLFPFKSQQTILIEELEGLKFDIIYFNTILTSSIIKKLSHLKAKKIWHIHELELAIKSNGAGHLNVKPFVDKVLANSNSTKNNLVHHGFESNAIEVIYPSIHLNKIQNESTLFHARRELNIPADAFIIGTSGTATETKGVQNFIALSIMMEHLLPGNTFYFIWVGMCPQRQKIVIDYDIAKSGKKDRILFIGEQKNPFPYYKSFDVFVSVSKEESFGLSVMEAASLNKPLICFKNTGGVEEIVMGAGNRTINYMDLYQMAQAIIELNNDKTLSKKLGDKAYDYAKGYDSDIIMPKMHAFLKTRIL